MPLVFKEVQSTDAHIAVWHIEEEDSFFLERLILSDWEHEFYQSLHHYNRKMSWLASRYLLKVLLDTKKFVELLFDVHGKPFLGSQSHFISLSHTHHYAAAVISKTEVVGIDVEDCSRDISSIAQKFLSATEWKQMGESPNNSDLLLYWGAKEVMYKMYGKKKLDFKNDMFVKPFEIEQRGSMTGVLMKEQLLTNYQLHYVRNEAFSLVTGTGGESMPIL